MTKGEYITISTMSDGTGPLTNGIYTGDEKLLFGDTETLTGRVYVRTDLPNEKDVTVVGWPIEKQGEYMAWGA